MQPYKGYFITGNALIVHPFSPDWYVGGSVLVPGRSSSIVEVTRFQLQRFTVASEKWQNGSGWNLRGSWWMNAWLHDGIEWRSTSNTPAQSVKVIWERW